jgi:hypothetical protein
MGAPGRKRRQFPPSQPRVREAGLESASLDPGRRGQPAASRNAPESWAVRGAVGSPPRSGARPRRQIDPCIQVPRSGDALAGRSRGRPTGRAWRQKVCACGLARRRPFAPSSRDWGVDSPRPSRRDPLLFRGCGLASAMLSSPHGGRWAELPSHGGIGAEGRPWPRTYVRASGTLKKGGFSGGGSA